MPESTHKPPTRAALHGADVKNRNIEFANAISGYCEGYCKPDNTKERNENILEVVRGWAMEIVFNCDEELSELNK